MALTLLLILELKFTLRGGGVVAFVGWRGGYGLTLEIEHGFGYRTIYAHLENVKT